jgi:hypothetical protein
MNEPQFIRSKVPHEVSMPEGSQVAKSKSADVGSPTIRQVLVETDTHAPEEITEDSLVISPTIETKVLNDVTLNIKAPEAPQNLPQPEKSYAKELSDLVGDEPEMNFPARLINLKIENDKVKVQLDRLESQMGSGVR